MQLHTHMQGNGLNARLLRGGIGSIGIQLLDIALSLLLAVVLARLLGPDGFGIYTYVFALVSLISLPAKFGMPGLVTRETARAEVTENWGLMQGVWRWTNRLALGLSLALALVSVVIIMLTAGHFTTLQITTFAWGVAFEIGRASCR